MSKALPVLLATLLVVLSTVAAAFGMADIYRREAATLMGEWYSFQGEAEIPAWAWEQAQRYLWLANRLAPFDPQILSDLGQLYELRHGEAPGPEASADLERALGYYRQALALRPAWPDAWTDVALLKVTQENIDAEFAFALQRAFALGPWETRVQASLAGGGLRVWGKLPMTLQTGVERSVARGLLSDSRLMRAVARRFDLLVATGTHAARAPSTN
jgi:tetratricopeptide (TPR) repeat protein